MMNEIYFFTIYEAKAPGLISLILDNIFVLLFCGILAFLIVRFLIPTLYQSYKEKGFKGLFSDKLNIIFICITLIFSCFIVLPTVGVIDSIVSKNKLYKCYLSGECDYVEGIIEDFYPMPANRHDTEEFRVNGIQFSYAGYNNDYCYAPVINGGYLKEGVYARIWYVNDDHNGVFIDSYIFRIDIYIPK